MSDIGEFLERYRDQEERQLRELISAVRAVSSALQPLSEAPLIESRLKSPTSTWKKMQRYGLAFEEVHDLIGLRVIVDDVAQCYQALELLQRDWKRWERFKDYIAVPKPNGYQSIHLCVRLSSGIRAEIQIRTHTMHQKCETGRAAHGRYKHRSATQSLRMRTNLARPRIAAA